ncbi:hypothetical protein KAR52_02310 [Candidatus Pacearchaeota archaeon]|nr:hypothetical protein [Candidatus Pacearchaeota archaeon]
MDWYDCNFKNFVKEIKVDINLINSLIKISKNKLESNNQLSLNKITSSTKISILYDSLREILEAIAIKKGFKIYNHECFTSFLYEICKEKSFARQFDEFRRIRNKINYYGAEIPLPQTRILITGIIKLRKTLIEKYLK